MMPIFNRNWVGACRGRWAGPGLLAGLAAGYGRGNPLQKQERRGSARASPVAAPMPKSVFS